MSDSRIQMSDFIANRQETTFFEMPQDSLITLLAHRPVWQKILFYLPMAAKKNLRLANPRELKNVFLHDPKWIWTVNLGDQIQYPEFFYDSTTPIKLNFPKGHYYYYYLIPNPNISDQMIELIEKIKPRIIGLAVHQVTLRSYTDQLIIEGLHFIEIDGIESPYARNMSKTTLQFITANMDSLQEIYLRSLIMSDDVNLLLKNVTLHNVKKLQMRDSYCFSDFLRACPNVERMTIDYCLIYFTNEDFSPSHLSKLYLKSVRMHPRSMNILKEKLPGALKLEDCMDKYCKVYSYESGDFIDSDDDEFMDI